MLIDWFTVAAQTINFLILVWLLKRFLYKPIINAIDARETGIKKERGDADSVRKDAEKQREDFQQKSAAFDQDRAAQLKKVAEEVAAERQRLMSAAQAAADALTAKRDEALRAEAKALGKSITLQVQDEVFAVARSALKDLADAELEECVCDLFTRRLADLADQPKAALSKAAQGTSDPIILRSAFDLNGTQREAIESAVKACLSTDARLQFVTAPELIGGVELTVGGQKLSWNIAGYLSSLKLSLEAVLKTSEHAQADPDAEEKKEATTA